MEWIPVSERLPETYDRYLFWVADGVGMAAGVGIALYKPNNLLVFPDEPANVWLDEVDYEPVVPTHWSPLPAPPPR